MLAVAISAAATAADQLLTNQTARINAVMLLTAQLDHRNWTIRGRDIYEFGVYTGGGLKTWVDELARSHIHFHNLYGFDSFAGLPEVNLDDEDPHIRKRQRQGPRAKGISKGQDGTYMGPGGYNAAKRLNVSDPTLLMDRIKRTVNYQRGKTELIKGFFNESLPALPWSMIARMRPAILVDFDGDYYSSTIDPAEFLIRHCLLVPGTFVYYDDMSICRPGSGCGEGKAHDEYTAKYGIRWRRLTRGFYVVVRMARPPAGCAVSALTHGNDR